MAFVRARFEDIDEDALLSSEEFFKQLDNEEQLAPLPRSGHCQRDDLVHLMFQYTMTADTRVLKGEDNEVEGT